MKQTTLGSTDWALKTKVTRRAKVEPVDEPIAILQGHQCAAN